MVLPLRLLFCLPKIHSHWVLLEVAYHLIASRFLSASNHLHLCHLYPNNLRFLCSSEGFAFYLPIQCLLFRQHLLQSVGEVPWTEMWAVRLGLWFCSASSFLFLCSCQFYSSVSKCSTCNASDNSLTSASTLCRCSELWTGIVQFQLEFRTTSIVLSQRRVWSTTDTLLGLTLGSWILRIQMFLTAPSLSLWLVLSW